MTNESQTPRRLAISVVSHGQGELLRNLLIDLRAVAGNDVEIIVTLNVPEPEHFLTDLGYDAIILRNKAPKGFGANHNQAFAHSQAKYFAVLNPDVRCDAETFGRLLKFIGTSSCGVCAPLVFSPAGSFEDSARRYPTVGRIADRVLKRLLRRKLAPDYDLSAETIVRVDWVAGMFMLFASSAFRAVGGFDERYFMYLEDADICRRLARSGFASIIVGNARVIHDARRATLRSFRHFRWHATSMLRFLMGSALRS